MGAGIFLDSGSVTGSITNNSGGLIEGLGYTTDIGIAVEGGTINSGIDNTGTIRGCSANFNSRCGVSDSYTYTGYGIALLSSATVTGGITNNSGGVIEGVGYEGGFGIFLDGNSTINGGIVNSGTISGSETTGSNRGGHGIALSGGSTNNGGILHNLGGLIQGNDNGNNNAGFGISLFSSASITGGITNHGDIKGMAAGESGYGILVSASSVVTGDITNTGTIEGIAGSDSDYSAFGIKFENGATLNGTINNSGMIRGIACDRYYY